tara:strand:- start:2381 stop:3199 length:819 start_codon:yes stop_codon:yes gene_type:complete
MGLNGNKLIEKCRLCDGIVSDKFELKVLGKYDVQYKECTQCLSLQTEAPYWLDEVYGEDNLSNTDTGAVQRNLTVFTVCYTLFRLLDLKNIIDFGGGDGLLCRLLRDHNANCYVKDKYATPTYAQGYTEQDFTKPDLITAFEVLEHLSNPMTELAEMFAFNSDAALFSTEIYKNHTQDWWYLSAVSGQHVFFYSYKSLEMIAEKYNYNLIVNGNFILFVKKISKIKKIAVKILLNKFVQRMLKPLILSFPTSGVGHDHRIQSELSKKSQQNK